MNTITTHEALQQLMEVLPKELHLPDCSLGALCAVLAREVSRQGLDTQYLANPPPEMSQIPPVYQDTTDTAVLQATHRTKHRRAWPHKDTYSPQLREALKTTPAKTSHELWFEANKEMIAGQYPKGHWVACSSTKGVVWTGPDFLAGFQREDTFGLFFGRVGMSDHSVPIEQSGQLGAFHVYNEPDKSNARPHNPPDAAIRYRFIYSTTASPSTPDDFARTDWYSKDSLVDSGADICVARTAELHPEDILRLKQFGDAKQIPSPFAADAQDDWEAEPSYHVMAEIQVVGTSHIWRTTMRINAANTFAPSAPPVWLAGRLGFLDQQAVTFVGAKRQSTFQGHQPGTIIFHDLEP